MKMRIKRCPFCNGRTYISNSIEEVDMWEHLNGFYISCRDCEMAGPFMPFDLSKRPANEDFEEYKNRIKRECIQKWNDAVVKFGIVNKSVNYEDSSLSPGAEAATEKQMKFANSIASRLILKLPIEKSKYNIRNFISEHIKEFNKKSSYRRSYYDDFGDYDDYVFDEY